MGIETKVAAGSTTFLAAGYIVSFVIQLVPWLHQHLTGAEQQQAVFIVAWLLGSLAAYFAPHTPRPVQIPAQPGQVNPPVTPVNVR